MVDAMKPKDSPDEKDNNDDTKSVDTRASVKEALNKLGKKVDKKKISFEDFLQAASQGEFVILFLV